MKVLYFVKDFVVVKIRTPEEVTNLYKLPSNYVYVGQNMKLDTHFFNKIILKIRLF